MQVGRGLVVLAGLEQFDQPAVARDVRLVQLAIAWKRSRNTASSGPVSCDISSLTAMETSRCCAGTGIRAGCSAWAEAAWPVTVYLAVRSISTL